MTIEPLISEQHLLERYARAERGVIMEFSGDISGDLLRLRDVCRSYAERQGLGMPSDEIFETYPGANDED